MKYSASEKEQIDKQEIISKTRTPRPHPRNGGNQLRGQANDHMSFFCIKGYHDLDMLTSLWLGVIYLSRKNILSQPEEI